MAYFLLTTVLSLGAQVQTQTPLYGSDQDGGGWGEQLTSCSVFPRHSPHTYTHSHNWTIKGGRTKTCSTNKHMHPLSLSLSRSLALSLSFFHSHTLCYTQTNTQTYFGHTAFCLRYRFSERLYWLFICCGKRDSL